MSIREIIRMGHPTLRQLARPVLEAEVNSPVFEQLVEDMRDTLRHSGGIGLAAPQINESLQLAVIEITDPVTRYGNISLIPFSIYINPVIEVVDETTKGYWEGCLSIPGLRGFVERPQHIRVAYRNEKFEPITEEFTGFSATVFQHEFDHLYGKLYVDRMKDLSRFAYEEEFINWHQPD